MARVAFQTKVAAEVAAVARLRAAELRGEARRAAALRAAAERAAAARAAEARADQQSAQAGQGGSTPPGTRPTGTPQQIAMAMLPSFGWSTSQFGCLDGLWARESGWNTYAMNPSSGAYGIPQALPGSKMASAGADWQSNSATQIRWGLGYIQATYGSPCAAWAHETATGWY